MRPRKPCLPESFRQSCLQTHACEASATPASPDSRARTTPHILLCIEASLSPRLTRAHARHHTALSSPPFANANNEAGCATSAPNMPVLQTATPLRAKQHPVKKMHSCLSGSACRLRHRGCTALTHRTFFLSFLFLPGDFHHDSTQKRHPHRHHAGCRCCLRIRARRRKQARRRYPRP